MLTTSNEYRNQKITLGVTNLLNLCGLASEHFAPSTKANGIGTLPHLFVTFVVVGWKYPTWDRVRKPYRKRRHANAELTRWLLVCAAAAIPFRVVRVLWAVLYALHGDLQQKLDPIAVDVWNVVCDIVPVACGWVLWFAEGAGRYAGGGEGGGAGEICESWARGDAVTMEAAEEDGICG